MLDGGHTEVSESSRHPVRGTDRQSGRTSAFVGALFAGLAMGLASHSYGAGPESVAVVLAAYGVCAAAFGQEPAWATLLPFCAAAARVAAPAVATAAIILSARLAQVPDVPALACLKVGAAAVLATFLCRRLLARWWQPAPLRAAVIGSVFSADSLARELLLAPRARYVIVGRIETGEDDGAGDVPLLGTLRDLGTLVAHHDIDLLLMTGEVPRLMVFDEVARSCLELPVRLSQLSSFYEEAFGHVPVGEINAAWFQYIMHPRYRQSKGRSSRVLDVVVAGIVLVLAAPLIAVFALIIRADGGPVFFRQTRIGEGGRPFTLSKLRTMEVNDAVAWAGADDPRITKIGRLLRRTHLDELPQVINVLRGEMSVIGPRPEQPAFVDRLENVVPFYTRRHLIKPGLTGWAQVRCGYAGSDLGSAWKVCHDLYYLKHRSFSLDLLIMFETLRTLVADPQYTAEPASVAFILGGAPAMTESQSSLTAG